MLISLRLIYKPSVTASLKDRPPDSIHSATKTLTPPGAKWITFRC